jgi:hypothetical protein
MTFPDDTPEFDMLYSSLYKTDMYYSLAKRQGRSLLAQNKVSQYFSAALGDNHWVAEVENWVHTALARTSINTWSIASGEDAVHEGRDGFVQLTNKHNLCGRYKYNPRGYQSIRFGYLLLVFLWLPVIWILTWNGNPIRAWLKKPSDFYAMYSKIALRKLDSWGSYLRRGDDNGATNNQISSAGVVLNVPTPHEESAVQSTILSSDEESSRRRTAVQQSDRPSQESRTADPHTSATRDLGTIPTEDKTEYETLLVWQLLYCLLTLVLDVSLFLVLLLAIPVSYILGTISRISWG